MQQVYGGGLGWTPILTPVQQLDLKADVHYEMQSFIQPPAPDPVDPQPEPDRYNVRRGLPPQPAGQDPVYPDRQHSAGVQQPRCLFGGCSCRTGHPRLQADQPGPECHGQLPQHAGCRLQEEQLPVRHFHRLQPEINQSGLGPIPAETACPAFYCFVKICITGIGSCLSAFFSRRLTCHICVSERMCL